ncbi:MAG TPA: glycosyltransferase family 2 protein [Polyangia bacterium]
MGNPGLERTAPTLPLPPAEKTGVSVAPKVAIVIPAFNESTTIQEVVAMVRAAFDWVIVIDDGSADDTAALALAAGAHVLVHPINLGQGAALQTGLEYAIQGGADLIATFDADGQHCVEDIPVMIAAIEKSGAEIALGSRFLGSTESMPTTRKLLLKAATLFTRVTTGLRLTDAHNGMRLFTRAGAKKIQIRQNRMAHASEILSQIAELRVPFIEVPVTVRYTQYSMAKGQSSLGAINIVLDLIIQRLK